MESSFFTPQQIQSRKKQPYRLSLIQSYDFTLLQQDLFQLVSPHVQSISDQKKKIISWLKKTSLIERMDILTYTNKEFVCLIRSMYEKKQSSYYDDSSTTFTISYIEETDEFDLLTMINNKKLTKQYYQAEDDLLANIRIMSRYTQFDSITFSQNFIRNVDSIFHLFQLLGDGIAHQLTQTDFERLSKLPNSVMFYDPTEQHCYKKATIGTWLTEVFMKHISMKYLQHELKQISTSVFQLKERIKDFQKYWKIITPERKNQIIKKVLFMKPIDLYQQHRLMIKVTRNGFPPIQKSQKIPQLIKQILTSNQKEIFAVLFYSDLNQTLESHSILKYYITLELQDEIKRYQELQTLLTKENKMKKKKKKTQKHQEQSQKKLHQNNKVFTQQKSLIVDHKNSQISTDLKGNLNTKGNDLFYKKLEVSQTHQIISFQSNYNKKKQQKQNQLVCENIETAKQSKSKKKKKNKKKNKNLKLDTQDTIIESSQKFDQSHQASSSHQQNGQNIGKTNQIHCEQKPNNLNQNQRFHHLDKISEKSSETTNDHNQESKLQSSDEQIHNEKQTKTSNHLGELMKDLEKKINFFNKQRKIVLNRLSYVFAQHELQFKLYGSSSYNLALPSSDIDIVVDPSIVNYFYFSYSNYRKKIINSLEYLQKVFEKFEWTADFQLLPGANIPLLTFTVNPGVDFQVEGTLYNNKKQLKQEIKISVDITIESYVNMTDEIPLHLGVQSSQLVKEWISSFPFYSELLTLMKIFAKNHNLNKIYHGGISSFMHAVLLAAFYKKYFTNLASENLEFENKKQKLIEFLPSGFHLTQMFIQYCKFIINFDEQKQIIDVNSNSACCQKLQTIPTQQLAIKNPLTGGIMSQRCTSFKLYKKLIQQVYDAITTKKQTEVKQYLQIVFDQ